MAYSADENLLEIGQSSLCEQEWRYLFGVVFLTQLSELADLFWWLLKKCLRDVV